MAQLHARLRPSIPITSHHQEIHRHGLTPQDELFPLASDRRTWLACRNQTISVADSKGAYAAVGEEQQGFYSQEEIKALVNYAAARNITIVPEIDMPGHAEAALHSYPELGCFNRPVEIPKLGFTPNIFCAGKENTLQFLKTY